MKGHLRGASLGCFCGSGISIQAGAGSHHFMVELSNNGLLCLVLQTSKNVSLALDPSQHGLGYSMRSSLCSLPEGQNPLQDRHRLLGYLWVEQAFSLLMDVLWDTHQALCNISKILLYERTFSDGCNQFTTCYFH